MRQNAVRMTFWCNDYVVITLCISRMGFHIKLNKYVLVCNVLHEITKMWYRSVFSCTANLGIPGLICDSTMFNSNMPLQASGRSSPLSFYR